MSTEVANSGGDAPDVKDRFELYNDVVRQAKLVDIVLSNVEFKVDRSTTPPSQGVPSFGGMVTNFVVVESGKSFGATIRWDVSIKKGRKNYVRCSASYDILYAGFRGCEEWALKMFAENVGRPATYTYFRALFANLDWSAGIGLPPLPVIHFHPKVK